MKRLGVPVHLAAWALLAGCGSADLSRPSDVRWGEEACAFCRMIISDDRFGAAIVCKNAEVLKFDDIGCLIRHEAGQVRPAAVYWVRGFTGHGWLDARSAIYFDSAHVKSPMDYGLAAQSAAEAARDPEHDMSARTVRFDELPSLIGSAKGEPALDRSKPE
jgi:copper chaperone NosL